MLGVAHSHKLEKKKNKKEPEIDGELPTRGCQLGWAWGFGEEQMEIKLTMAIDTAIWLYILCSPSVIDNP